MFFRPRLGYPPPLGAFGKGNFPRNRSTLSFHDLQQGLDGFRTGRLGTY